MSRLCIAAIRKVPGPYGKDTVYGNPVHSTDREAGAGVPETEGAAMRSVREIVGAALRRLRATDRVTYDVISDRYVCPSGRHDSPGPAGPACGCGRERAGARAQVGRKLPTIALMAPRFSLQPRSEDHVVRS